MEYIAPASAVFQSPVTVGEYVSHLRCFACPSQWWGMLHPRWWRFAVLQDLEVFKILRQHRVQRPFSEMEGLVVDFKTLFQDRVQQRLVEQMVLITSSSAPKSSSWSAL